MKWICTTSIKHAITTGLLTLHLCAIGQVSPAKLHLKDAETGAPIPYASITAAGKHLGTSSNEEGVFSLTLFGLLPSDTLIIGHIGYHTRKIVVADCSHMGEIVLAPKAILLSNIDIRPKPISAEEILLEVRRRLPINHPQTNTSKRIYFHKNEHVHFSPHNTIHVKSPSFPGLSQAIVSDILASMPSQFTDHQDAIFDLYQMDGLRKVVQVSAVAFVAQHMVKLQETIERKLRPFLDDVDETVLDNRAYFKFRTGVFSFKEGKHGALDLEGQTLRQANLADPTAIHVNTNEVLEPINLLFDKYANIQGKNWEFIHHTSRYTYTLEAHTVYNGQLVHKISFMPKSTGLFEGYLIIDMRSYAVLKAEFAFSADKSTENLQLLGVGHSMAFKSGSLTFAKSGTSYDVDHMSVVQHEEVSISRDFTVTKKRKGPGHDRAVNTIKLKADLQFEVKSSWEIKVLGSLYITPSKFSDLQQLNFVKYRKKVVDTDNRNQFGTIIAPIEQRIDYVRKAF